MSIPLPDTDLSSAQVGSTGEIDFGYVGLPGHPPGGGQANLFLANESGAGLQITWVGGPGGFPLMSGAWGVFPVPPNATGIKYLVNYILPNAQVSKLVGAYYNPNETPPTTMTLGNSPIGVTQTSQPITVLNQALNMALTSPVVINGNQGTVTCWQWISGQFIYTELYFNGYENTGPSAQDLTLSIPYASIAQINAGGWGSPDTLTLQCLHNNLAINFSIANSTAGGGHTTSTGLQSWVPLAECHAFETITLPNGYTGAGNGWIHIVGV